MREPHYPEFALKYEEITGKDRWESSEISWAYSWYLIGYCDGAYTDTRPLTATDETRWRCSACGRDKFTRPGQPHWCNGVYRKRFKKHGIVFVRVDNATHPDCEHL